MPEQRHGVEYPPPPLWEILDRIATKPSHFSLGDVAHWAALARDALTPPKVGNGGKMPHKGSVLRNDGTVVEWEQMSADDLA